jgi:hypothetical protein
MYEVRVAIEIRVVGVCAINITISRRLCVPLANHFIFGNRVGEPHCKLEHWSVFKLFYICNSGCIGVCKRLQLCHKCSFEQRDTVGISVIGSYSESIAFRFSVIKLWVFMVDKKSNADIDRIRVIDACNVGDAITIAAVPGYMLLPPAGSFCCSG